MSIPPALVATGANTFGTNDSGQVIFGKSEWHEPRYCRRLLPALSRRRAVSALAKTGIREPKDLIGKTIAYNEGGPWAFTQAMRWSAGVDMSKIKTVVAIGNEVLMNGTVDAKTAFIVNGRADRGRIGGLQDGHARPGRLRRQRLCGSHFLPRKPISTPNLDVVKRFVAATAKGWDYALAHQEEAVKAVLALDNQLDPEQQKRQLALLEKDFIVTQGHREERDLAVSTARQTIKDDRGRSPGSMAELKGAGPGRGNLFDRLPAQAVAAQHRPAAPRGPVDSRHRNSAVNFWIFLQAFSSASSEVA